MRALLFLLLLTIGAAAEPLTLESAVQEAVSNSPAVREAEARVLEALYGVDEAAAGGNPRLELSAGYQFLTPTLNFGTLPIVENHNYQVQLGLHQAIATFGRLHWATAAAELRRQSATEEVRRQRDQVRAEVEQAWARLWFARQTVEVAGELTRAREEHVRLVQLQVVAGAASRFDVLSSQAVEAEAREQLAAAESEESLARSRLLSALGRPVEQPLEIAPPPDPPAQLPDLDAGAARALAHRPELTSLSWAVEAAMARVELEESQGNPTLSFSTTYAQRNATAFQTDSLWSTGLQLSLPLFDGGVSEARADAARAVVAQLREAREKLRRMVRLEVEEAYRQLALAHQRRALSVARLAQTTEALRIARLRYRVGISINQEVLDAQSAHSRACLDRHRAELEARVAWAWWVRATSGGPRNEPESAVGR